MDDKDWQIIRLLRENSRLSNSEIGRILNVSEGTVRKRISRMLATGAIKKFTVVTGNEGVDAIILVRLESKKTKNVIEEIRKRFDEIYEYSGRVDLAVKINCSSLDELNSIVDSIRAIDGVRGTDTLIRLK